MQTQWMRYNCHELTCNQESSISYQAKGVIIQDTNSMGLSGLKKQRAFTTRCELPPLDISHGNQNSRASNVFTENLHQIRSQMPACGKELMEVPLQAFPKRTPSSSGETNTECHMYPVVIITCVHYLGPPGPFSFPDFRDLLEVLGGLPWQRERGGP